MESTKTFDTVDHALTTGAGHNESAGIHGVFTWECYDSAGNLKWSDVTHNIVTTEGKNWMLDVVLQNGVTSPVWYMTLVTSNTTVSAGSTYVSPGNSEVGTGTFGATRPTMTFGSAAASGVKTASTTSFSITGTAIIYGNLVVTGSSAVADTTSNATRRLLSTSLFASQKNVSSGDTLNVTYSLTIS